MPANPRRAPGLQHGMFDADSAPDPAAPLAARMRPRTLDEMVGQRHLLAPDAPLRRQAARREPHSCILWGPPGSGKTTLARAMAAEADARFAALSAVSGGVADVRAAVAEAETARRDAGIPTILFIDEIHRFNKAQQDAVLHAMEDGIVSLIGATTENPSFEVIAPLLSRTRVYRLEPLEPGDMRSLLQRALSDPQRGLARRQVQIDDDALEALVQLGGGDARVALNALEFAADDAPGDRITADRLARVAQRALMHDKAGDAHYDVVSAMIKSVRGSDPDAAVYWLARLLEAGEDPMFAARRLVILAAEDIGLADPRALPVAVAAQQAVHLIGMPEATLILSEAAIYLARAPKSNSAMRAYSAAAQAVREHGALPVPLHLRNAVTGLMRAHGYGDGYQYAHDYDDPPDQQHLPDQLAATTFYQPGTRDAP